MKTKFVIIPAIIIILSNGMEIPYTLKDGKLSISVDNSHVILIIGFSKI